jgi:hypothetical protein
MTSFDWTGVGMVVGFILFCVVLTFAPAFRSPRRRFRISDRELRKFFQVHAPAAVRPGRVARLLTCCFRRYHP